MFHRTLRFVFCTLTQNIAVNALNILRLSSIFRRKVQVEEESV